MAGSAAGVGCLRVSAGLTILLGLSLLWSIPSALPAAGYLGLLAGLGAGVAMLAGLRLWFSGCFVARTLAVSVALACAGGQILDRTVGLPGGVLTDRPSDLTLLAVLAVASSVTGLMIVESRVRSQHPAAAGPYVIAPPA